MDSGKAWVDVSSIGIVLATLADWLPELAALVSVLWGCIRIYETKTVQGWVNKRKNKRKTTP